MCYLLRQCDNFDVASVTKAPPCCSALQSIRSPFSISSCKHTQSPHGCPDGISLCSALKAIRKVASTKNSLRSPFLCTVREVELLCSLHHQHSSSNIRHRTYKDEIPGPVFGPPEVVGHRTGSVCWPRSAHASSHMLSTSTSRSVHRHKCFHVAVC